MILAAILLLSILGATVLIVVILRQSKSPGPPADPAWIDGFSADRYRPMERLLAGGDFAFVATQSGLPAATVRRMRKDRQRLFRRYLRNLVRDFNRIHACAVQCALSATVDRPELSGALVRQKLSFHVAVCAMRVQLALHVAGIGSVDVQDLLGTLRDLCTETRGLRTHSAAA